MFVSYRKFYQLTKFFLFLTLLTGFFIIVNNINSYTSEVFVNLFLNNFDFNNYFYDKRDKITLKYSSNLYEFSTNDRNYTNMSNLCPLLPPNLQGRVTVNQTSVTYESIEKEFSSVFTNDSGGHWKPHTCEARYKVAIIVPYRNRIEHLNLFLRHMHSFLPKQFIDYSIYIIEQYRGSKFNRGLLLNIGFVESLKDYDWDCFVFHDVDLVPEDDRNLYYCPAYPRHMSVAVSTFNYKLPYRDIFGGVSIINKNDFEKINGYSNLYFGWGGEDDDILRRIKHKHLAISRFPPNVARYLMLSHKKGKPNKERFDLLKTGKHRYEYDGLNDLAYFLVNKTQKRLYTWVLVKPK